MPKQTAGWWRDFFHDHLLKDTKGSIAWAANSKLKVYCKECWNQHFSSIEMEVIAADASNATTSLPRTPEGITAHCEFNDLVDLWSAH